MVDEADSAAASRPACRSRGRRLALASAFLALVTIAAAVPFLESLKEEWLLWRLGSDHPQMRGDYATVLGQMGSRRAASRIVRQSVGDEEANSDLRPYFLGLRDCPNPGDLETLILDLDDGDRGIRCRAAMALAFVRSQESQENRVEALKRALRGSDPLVARVATGALEIILRPY